MASHKRLIDTR